MLWAKLSPPAPAAASAPAACIELRPLPSHNRRACKGRAACVGRDGTVAAADPVAAWVVGPKGSWTMAAAALATPGAPVELAAAAPDGPAAQPPLDHLAAIGAPGGAGEPVGSGQTLAADPLDGGAAAYGAPAASAEPGAEAQPQQLLQPLPDQQEEQAPQDVQQPADQQEQQPEQQPQLAAAAEAGQQAAADAFAAVSAQPGTAAGSPADLDSLLQQQLGQPQQHAQIEPPQQQQQAQQQAQQQQPDAATAAAADEWGDDAEDADPNASTGLFIPGTEGAHGGEAWAWCAAGWRTAGWHRRRLLPHSSHAVPQAGACRQPALHPCTLQSRRTLPCHHSHRLHPPPCSLSAPAEAPQQLTVADVNGMAAHVEGQWSAEEEQELVSICTNEAHRAVRVPCIECIKCKFCSG